MINTEEVKKRYLKLKEYIDEAGAFFRNKAHYSLDEQIAFISSFYANFTVLTRIFEEEAAAAEEQKEPCVHIGKVSLTKRQIEQEFETTVSVIYFNLTKEEIAALEDRAKAQDSLKDALILKKLFDKYLAL